MMRFWNLKMLVSVMILSIFFFLTPLNSNAGVQGDGNDWINSNFTYSSGPLTFGGWFVLDNTPPAETEPIGSLVDLGGGVIPAVQIYFTASSLAPICTACENALSGCCTVTSGVSITAGVPFHAACVLSGAGALTFYLDGTSVGTPVTGNGFCDGTMNVSSRPFGIIGRNRTGTLDGFFDDGKVYEAAFWSAALTAAEVAQWYNSKQKYMPCQIRNASLEKYLSMDEGSAGASSSGGTVNSLCGVDTDSASISATTNTWISQSTINLPIGMR